MTIDLDDNNKQKIEISESVKEYLATHAFKTNKETLDSFSDYLITKLSKSPIFDQLANELSKSSNKTKISVSSQDSSVSDYFETRSSLSEEQRDIFDIAYIASKQASVDTTISCVSFTCFKSVNPSLGYKYANTPQYNTCSNEHFVKSANTNSPLPCGQNFLALSSCSYFSPDATLIAKNSVSDNVFSLGKYRSITGNFIYVIYDKDLNVYQILNYKGITDKDNSLDAAAIEVYNDFLSNQMMLETTSIDIPAKVQESPTKSSYLLSLIS